MKILNAAQMQAADAHAIRDLKIPSLTLMENAATRVGNVITSRYPGLRAVLLVCGKGNNGGDGMAVARLLKQHGWNPAVVLLGRADELKADPAVNWQRALDARIPCVEIADDSALDHYVSQCELIVDAIFGTGIAKPLEGIYSQVVQRLNRSGKEILSIDVPSGLSSDSGQVLGPAVKADVTVALASFKYCHILPPACRMCGELYAVDIGIPVESTTTVLSAMDVRRVLPHRKPDSHKGTYGHAAVIAGSTGKSGAAYLAGKGALRSGAGLSTIISPARVQQTVASLGPEVMTHIASGHPDYFNVDAANDVVSACADKNAVAIGPGIGTHEETRTFLQILIPQIKSGLVIDADGLNLLARDRSVLGKRLPRSTVLTPHPGEMARLLGMDTAAVQNDRIGSAARLASETQSIVILKGYRTILADPQGTIRICPTGSYPLASAGTGDVLTGAIVGFIAQGLTPMDAAQAGVYIHGFTANLFEREFPQQALNAGDILNDWNRAVHLVRTAKDLEGEYLGIHLLL